VDHGGSWGGYRAQLLRFPDRHFSVACLCNLASANPDHRARRVAAIYLGEEMKPAPKESPDEEPRKKKPSMSITPAQPAPYVGAYWSEELGVYYVFALKNGALYWTEIRRAEGSPRAKPAKELRPVGPGEFAFDSYGLQFHFRPSADGVPAAFSLDAGRTLGIQFVRRPLPEEAGPAR